jgi:hypothetical protein
LHIGHFQLEEINQTCRQKLEKLTREIAKFKEQEQKAIKKPETTKVSPCLFLLTLETWTDVMALCLARNQDLGFYVS